MRFRGGVLQEGGAGGQSEKSKEEQGSVSTSRSSDMRETGRKRATR